MSGHQFAFSAAPLRKVKEVQFGILSPEEIVRPCSLLPLLLLIKFSFHNSAQHLCLTFLSILRLRIVSSYTSFSLLLYTLRGVDFI